MADNSGWCTIESDPGVFSEMIANFGVKGVVVEELIASDPSMVRELGEPLGLVLLFKYTPQIARLPRNVMPDAQGVYFAKQVVGNACATQAIINTLLNHADEVELGDELKTFYDFSQHLPADMRGEQIGESSKLRDAHNAFSRQSMFSFEDDRRRSSKEEENYHFVAFTFKNGAVWELDGLREGPVFIESVEKEGWVELACSAIQARIEEIGALDTSGSGRGISFALMAIVRDRLPDLIRRRDAAAASGGDDANLAQLAADIARIEADRAEAKQANIRRRHNYFPAFVALLRALRDEGKLQACVDAAKQRAEESAAARKARKQN